MSNVHIPRVLSTRGKTAVDAERENFEKSQTSSIQKAINIQECATKEKHARVVIIGTHHDKSAHLFWNIARRLPLQENPIIAWKFCHVVHKLLRDGHPAALSDSARYVGTINDLGRLWGHLKEGYGRLIACYTKLIVQKIQFHKKNTQIPGNLFLEDDQLDKICNHDINSYFELGVDVMDYMDDILSLQSAVFGSLDMSRANSMTSSGQCRLAPLILCIQDSCPLYDYLVKILFRLHSSLPPDTLGGHRDRFYAQYRTLKQFYASTSNLQYFKNLIRIPSLPDTPPNFLRASDLSSHVKPMAVVPEPDTSDVDSQSEMEEAIIDQLIDTSSTQAESFGHNGVEAVPQPDERDQLIEQLKWEVNQLKRELARVKAEDQMVIESLHNRVRELEMELNELRQIAESTTHEAETLREVLKDQEKNTEVASRFAMVEKIAKSNEEKFKKMKDIYGKLREEHVQLLRAHSDSTKLLHDEKRAKEEVLDKQRTLNQEIFELKNEKKKVESTLVQSSEATQKLETATKERDELRLAKQDLEEHVKKVESARQELEQTITTCRSDAERLRSELDSAAAGKADAERAADLHRTEADRLRHDLEAAVGDQTSVARSLSERSAEVERLGRELETVMAEKKTADKTLAERTTEKEKLQSQLQQLTAQHASAEATAASRQTEIEQLRHQLDTSVAEHNKLSQLSTQRQTDIDRLTTELSTAKTDRESTAQKLRDSESLIARLNADVEKLRSDHNAAESALRSQLSNEKRQMLASAVAEGETIIREALAQSDNPHHSTITCTAEYLLNRTQPALDSLSLLTISCDQLSHDENAIYDAIKAVCEFSHQLGDTVVFGFATAHTASIEAGEELGGNCKSAGDESLELLSVIKSGSLTDVGSRSARVETTLRKILAQAELLLPKVEDIGATGDLVDEEMQQTTKAIEEAAAKIAAMLASSRENCSGIQLEVNEKILDSCNQLMKAIRVLIEKSKTLQKEIVAQGRGTSSLKDFYKKHHRWTEGLISAAKAVGWGANVLVDAADRVVKGKGKYEELVVCSQEIAASTAQLVVASKVKAQRGSENLHQLSDASKGVSTATGLVVASAKSGAERVEEMDTMDFSKLTLHQAKRLEMESQVHVLELESQLEKERRSLSELRKAHYRLAGESEGWDQEEFDEEGLDWAQLGAVRGTATDF